MNITREDIYTHLAACATRKERIDLLNRYIYKIYQKDLDFARELSEEALQLSRESGTKANDSTIIDSMAAVYQKSGNLSKAEELFRTSLELSRLNRNYEIEVATLEQLGTLYLQTGRLEKAEEVLLKALDCSEKNKIFNYLGNIHNSLKDLYMRTNDYKKACFHFESLEKQRGRKDKQEVSKKMTIIESDLLRKSSKRIRIISMIGQKITATLDLDKVLDVIYENINSIMEAEFFGIARLDRAKNQIEYALFVDNGVRLDSYYTSLDNKSSLAALAIREKRDIFISDFIKEYWDILPQSPEMGAGKFGENTETYPQSILCCPLVIADEVTGVIMVESYKKNAYTISDMDSLKALASYVAIALENASQSGLIRQQNKTLSKINSRLKVMMREVLKKNDQMLSSIGYAEKIQYSTMPPLSIIDDFFSSHFLLYKPRDIVGGDFYWFRKARRGLLCIIGDCTGHGIPGALMVMAVNTLLTKINDDNFYDNPALLLTKMNILLKKTLKQEAEGSHSLSDDGADLGICYIPCDKSKLIFAGAKQSLYYSADNGIYEIKGDAMSIGYKRSRKDFVFTNHILPISPDTSYYMTTDGFKDQIGGIQGLPLGSKKLKQLLASLYKKNMEEQKVKLEQDFDTFSMNEQQVDDITVLGFKV